MIYRFVSVAAVLILLAGCGLSETVPVTGTVTIDGQPAAGAEVIFTPAKGRVASGPTNDQGKFTLSTNKPGDGAVPGDHKVTIVEYYPPGKPPPMRAGGPVSKFPALYADPAQSPFTAKVERGKTNDFMFEMKK